MYCSRCGKKLSEGMLFCPYCGTAIVVPEDDSEQSQPSAGQAREEEADRAFRPLRFDENGDLEDDAPAEPKEEYFFSWMQPSSPM